MSPGARPPDEAPGLTCAEVIALLADYLEATLGPESVESLERHLDGCPACRAYLNTYQRTRELTARVERPPMPEDLKARLRAFLVERLWTRTDR